MYRIRNARPVTWHTDGSVAELAECSDCGLSDQLPDESDGDMEEIPNVTIHGLGNRAFALSEADGSLNCWQTVEEVDDEIEEDDDDVDDDS